ncbi:MAG: hypothetical protein ACOC5F_00695 [Candidatus Aminicenantaceae bacterium]
MFFRKIKGIKILRILMVVFAVAVFAGPAWADNEKAIEVTLGFGWRNSDRNLNFIENYTSDSSFPFTVVIRDEQVLEQMYKDIYATLDYYHSADVSLIKRTTNFGKRGSFMFGLDFPVYKGFNLGFEFDFGVIDRKVKMLHRDTCKRIDIGDRPSFYNYDKTYTLTSREIIIPINFFLDAKYEFERVKDLTGFLRPYIGIGGGIVTAINWDDRLIGAQFYQLPNEKIGINGIGVVVVGVDLWITKKLAMFGEARYVKIKHGDCMEFVTGLRLK